MKKIEVVLKNILNAGTIGGFIFSAFLALLHVYGDVTVYGDNLNVLLIARNIMWLFVYYLVFCVYKYLLSFEKIQNEKINKASDWLYRFVFNKSILRLSLVLFICWIPHLIMKYPVGLHMDTLWEIVMSQGNHYSHYALFHILLIGYVYKFGQLLGNPNVVMFIYNVITAYVEALVFSFGLKKIDELKCPKWIINIGAIFLIINPLIGGYLATTTKDVNYSYYVFCLVALLIQYTINNKLFWKQKTNLVMLFVSSLFICLFRSNGVYIVIPTIIWITILEIKKKDIRKVVFLLLILLTPICVNKTLNTIYKFEKPGAGEVLSVPINQTARFIKYHKDLVSLDEKSVLEKYIPYDNFGDLYVPTSADLAKANFKADGIGDVLEYLKVWFKQFFKAPVTYVEAFLDQDIYLLYPRYNETKYYIECNDYYIDPVNQDEGFFQTPLIIKNNQYYYTVLLHVQHELPIYQLTTNIASFNILFLYSLITVIGKKKLNMLLPMLPLFLSFLISVVAPCVLSNGRYCFPVVYCFPLWLFIAYYSLKRTSKM